MGFLRPLSRCTFAFLALSLQLPGQQNLCVHRRKWPGPEWQRPEGCAPGPAISLPKPEPARKGAGPGSPLRFGDPVWPQSVPEPPQTSITFPRASTREKGRNCNMQPAQCPAFSSVVLSRDPAKCRLSLVMRESYCVAKGKDEINVRFKQTALVTLEDLPN